MKTKSLVINQDLRVSLREYNEESGKYGALELEIREVGMCGDVSLYAKVSRSELKNLLDFLRRCDQVLV